MRTSSPAGRATACAASSGRAPRTNRTRSATGSPRASWRRYLRGVRPTRGRKADLPAWTDPAEIEAVALEQLKNISSLPWVFHHVAAMPDVHFGKGATVGSVIAMKDAGAPAAVGVDIGCGMAAVKTSLNARDLPDDLRGIRSQIERAIPVGFHEHRDPIERPQDEQLWTDFQE